MDDPGFDSLQGQENYFLQNVQPGSGAHAASYSVGTGVKRPGLEAAQSNPSVAEATNDWIPTSTPLMHVCLYRYKFSVITSCVQHI